MNWLADAESEIAELEATAKDNPRGHYERRDEVKEAARRLAELSRRLNDLVRV